MTTHDVQGFSSDYLDELLGNVPPRKNGRILNFTVFAGTGSTAPVARRGTMDDIETLVRSTTIPPEGKLKRGGGRFAGPLLKLATFNEHGRDAEKGAIKSVDGVELDHDAREITAGAAADMLREAGVRALVFTSRNSPNWRIFAETSAPVTPAARRELSRRLAARVFPGVTFDTASFGNGCFFVGAVAGEPRHIELVDGESFDRLLEPLVDGAGGGAPDDVDDEDEELARILADAEDRLAFDQDAESGKPNPGLSAIPAEALTRDVVIRIMFALHLASEGDARGFALYKKHADRSPWRTDTGRPRDQSGAHLSDEALLRKQKRTWGRVRHKTGALTRLGTIYKMAQECGFTRAKALPPPSLGAAGAPGDWTLDAFDPDGEPGLSHDQLALDLGKAGWNRDARYCGPLGGWLLWRGQHWEPESGMRPMAIVRGFMRSKARLLGEWTEKRAATLDPKEAAKLLEWTKAQAKALRQDSNIAAVERLARSNPRSLATAEQWDSDDFLLGTPGGTVDLRTGELRDAHRGDYITRMASVAPAPVGSQPEAWLKFLAEVFPGDQEMIGFMRRLAGYTLTGSTCEHRLFLFHGSGRNGKGTLLGTLQDILGDYARGIPTSSLLEARSPQHASPLARLRGARFVRGAELPVGQAWNESLVKQLTGGDSITANLMRQDAFDFVPKFTLIVDGNTKPRVRTTDVAMRARMTLIPFTANFAGREDRTLPERLKAEAPAILRWAIEGAVEWQRVGLGMAARRADPRRAPHSDRRGSRHARVLLHGDRHRPGMRADSAAGWADRDWRRRAEAASGEHGAGRGPERGAPAGKRARPDAG